MHLKPVNIYDNLYTKIRIDNFTSENCYFIQTECCDHLMSIQLKPFEIKYIKRNMDEDLWYYISGDKYYDSPVYLLKLSANVIEIRNSANHYQVANFFNTTKFNN
uniref:Uncharacterized protein n=1 Tax=viral metagenome TaxID=1070528 RepID=A0A6C0JPY5_9ZZZZ